MTTMEVINESKPTKSLPASFKTYKYGISARLADISDSEFILSLRLNEKIGEYIHATSTNVEDQIKWMQEYKKREKRGEDYYFVFSSKGIPFGVSRISDIKGNRATGGSWICKPGTPVEHSIASMLIAKDIMFEHLGIDYDDFSVRKVNRQVQKVHQRFGAKLTHEIGPDLFYTQAKSDYLKNRDRFVKLLNLN